MKFFKLALVFFTLAFLIACSKESTTTTNTTNGTTTTSTKTTGAASTSDSSKLSDPKGSIEYQFGLVKAGDYDTLKNCCFTDRIKGNITKEMVDKAKVDAANYTMDDLYASDEDGEYEGKKTKKVKMKNGRTLTTLVQTDGKWLADTIWFK